MQPKQHRNQADWFIKKAADEANKGNTNNKNMDANFNASGDTNGEAVTSNFQQSDGSSIHIFMLGVDALGGANAFLSVEGKEVF